MLGDLSTVWFGIYGWFRCRCQNDYMLLKSNSAIRRQLFAIERGRCTECSLDTENLLSRLRCLPGSFGGIERRLNMILNAAPSWARSQKRKDAARRLAKHPVPGVLSWRLFSSFFFQFASWNLSPLNQRYIFTLDWCTVVLGPNTGPCTFNSMCHRDARGHSPQHRNLQESKACERAEMF